MRVKIFEEKPNIELETEINRWLQGNSHMKIRHIAQSTGFELDRDFGGRAHTVISIFYEPDDSKSSIDQPVWR